MEKIYNNVTLKVTERISKKTNQPYTCVVAVLKDSKGNNVEVFVGFENLAKELVYKLC